MPLDVHIVGMSQQAFTLSDFERVKAREREHSVRRLCQVMAVHPSWFYAWQITTDIDIITYLRTHEGWCISPARQQR